MDASHRGRVLVAALAGWALASAPLVRGSTGELCAAQVGDLTSDGFKSVVDVQCALVAALWELGDEFGPSPACVGDGDLQRADVNCDGEATVSDVLLVIVLALGQPLPPMVDATGDGCPDLCANPSCDGLDCSDGDACTVDECGAAGACVHSPVDCADGDVCTGDSCDVDLGCTHEALPCEDLPCTTTWCHPLLGCQYEPQVCADGLPCLELLGCEDGDCQYVENCDDGDTCTVDSCDPALGCVHTPVVCPSDDNTLTKDYCQATVGCVYEPIGEPICLLWGEEGDELQCPLRVLRESNLEGWFARSIGLTFHFDTNQLETLYLEDQVQLFEGGPVVWVPVPPYTLQPSGHTVTGLSSFETQNINGKGWLSIFHLSASNAPVTLAYLDGQTVVGDPTVLWFHVRLRTHVPQSDPVSIRVVPAHSLGTPKGTPAYTTVYDQMVFLPDPECNADTDCDDGELCTSDQCKLGGCIHGPKPTAPELCTHTVCDPVLGIIIPDCDDGDACTTDYCHPVLLDCQFTAIDVDDGDACTADFCDPILGIMHIPATCDDHSECTDDGCVAGLGCVNPPNGCDDGIACTLDECAPSPLGTSTCLHVTSDTTCDDGDASTSDSCDPTSAQADGSGCLHL